MNRLAIFFFFDQAGVVDDYVVFLLNDLKRNVDRLLIVCNGLLDPSGRQRLSSITPDLFVRENKGFDVWAYKEGIEHLGWERVSEYDELIMVNSTIFGPLYPFKEMFDAMDTKEVDFWGITKYHEIPFDPLGLISYGFMPEHIQSHFVAVRQPMLRSVEFRNHWRKMRVIRTYDEAVAYHEAIFTRKFADMGYTWSVYVDTSDLEGITTYPLMFMPLDLVKNRRCPIIKRKSFFLSYWTLINETCGEGARSVLDYIEGNLSYDVDMIWDNLIRSENQAHWKQALHLNRVLPESSLLPAATAGRASDWPIALLAHIAREDSIDSLLQYLPSLPRHADVFIATGSDSLRNGIVEKVSPLGFRNLVVVTTEDGVPGARTLLVTFGGIALEYDYVCFIHDSRSPKVKPLTVESSNFYGRLECLLKSREFVLNLLTTFEQSPRLGIAFPPPPNHGYYGMVYAHEWLSAYGATKELAAKLDLNVPIEEACEPIAPPGNMFWFRPRALKPLLEHHWEKNGFPRKSLGGGTSALDAIERVYSLVAQNEGFYSCWLMSTSFAEIEITNLNFLFLRERQVNNPLNFNLVNYAKYQVGHRHPGLARALKPKYQALKNVLARRSR